MCLGHFDPDHVLLDNEIGNFRGDVTNISAKKEALVVWSETSHDF